MLTLWYHVLNHRQKPLSIWPYLFRSFQTMAGSVSEVHAPNWHLISEPAPPRWRVLLWPLKVTRGCIVSSWGDWATFIFDVHRNGGSRSGGTSHSQSKPITFQIVCVVGFGEICQRPSEAPERAPVQCRLYAALANQFSSLPHQGKRAGFHWAWHVHVLWLVQDIEELWCTQYMYCKPWDPWPRYKFYLLTCQSINLPTYLSIYLPIYR